MAVLINLSLAGQGGKWPKQMQVDEIKTRAKRMGSSFKPRTNILPVEGGTDDKFARRYLEQPIAVKATSNGITGANRLYVHFKAKIRDEDYEGNGEVDVPQRTGRCELPIPDLVTSEVGEGHGNFRSRSEIEKETSGCLSMDVALETEAEEEKEAGSADRETGYMIGINKFGKGGRIHAGSVGAFKRPRRYIDEWLAGMKTEYLKKEALMGGKKFDILKEAGETAC